MKINSRGRRRVQVFKPEVSEHSFLTGDTLDAIWGYVDPRSVNFIEAEGEGVWSALDTSGDVVGRISLYMEPPKKSSRPSAK